MRERCEWFTKFAMKIADSHCDLVDKCFTLKCELVTSKKVMFFTAICLLLFSLISGLPRSIEGYVAVHKDQMILISMLIAMMTVTILQFS